MSMNFQNQDNPKREREREDLGSARVPLISSLRFPLKSLLISSIEHQDEFSYDEVDFSSSHAQPFHSRWSLLSSCSYFVLEYKSK